jgi:hypothetical protein
MTNAIGNNWDGEERFFPLCQKKNVFLQIVIFDLKRPGGID